MPTTALKGAHLSFQQDRLWSFQQGSRAYRSQCTVFIEGKLHVQVFQQALQHLVEQHTLFQTVFYAPAGMDVPLQVIGHPITFSCPMVNLEGIAEPERHMVLERLWVSLQEEAFDLSHGPLFRPVLFRLQAETTLLLIRVPALYADVFTLPLLLTDVAKRYSACLSGQEYTEEPLQYTAVSAWQKQILLEDGEAAKAARAFWDQWDALRLAQAQQVFEQAELVKPGSLQAAQQTVFEPLTFPLEGGEALSRQIGALAEHFEVEVATILLACWLIVLWRFTGESQLVMGVACDGRSYEELAEALGLYTRCVPFCAYIEENWTFERFVAFVEPLLEATRKYQSFFSWQSVPRTDTASIHPTFFPVTYEYMRWSASLAAGKLELIPDRLWCCTEPFLLKLSVQQVGECLQLELHYDPQSVRAERMPHIASLLQTLLACVVKQPQRALGALTLLTADEQRHLLTTFSGPVHSLSTQGWHRLFEAQVQRVPDQFAVVARDEQLTYQQLNSRANQLARVFRRRGVGPECRVGLCMKSSAQMLVGLLGILKAGGAYVPLDAESPPARLAYQLQASQTVFLLTQQELAPRFSDWQGSILCLEPDRGQPYPYALTGPEQLREEMAEAQAWDLPNWSEGEDIVSVIYTSGSTGVPKGVMIRQASMVNYALTLCSLLGAETGWQYATGSTLAADLGNTAIFCALASGGCVQVLDYETVTSVEAMARWTQQYPIDVLKIVPSHLSALLAEERGKAVLPRKALVLGGEILPESLLKRVSELGGTCEVFNHYGPTETTVGVLVHSLGVLGAVKENRGRWNRVPLGKPISNTQVYVLDRRMQVVPIGVTGELYIGGAGLAMGYAQQPDQTAERFVPHPFVGAVPCACPQEGARLYRTGDLARYTEEGTIEFLGRCDHQVKLRGYRIELAEIEAVLRQHQEVRDSVVVLQEDEPSNGPQLVGYIVPRKLPMPPDMNIQDFLRERLPPYMVPPRFVYLKFLPLTANGKVNRHQLATAKREENHSLPYLAELYDPSRTIVQPRDAIEWQLLQIWEDLLQIQPLSVIDDFFKLGGHSLLAVRLMSRIAKHFGQSLDLATLFRSPTVAQLAVILRQQIPSEEDSTLVPIQPQGTRPPFFCVPPGGGTAFCYANLARRLGPDQPFYGLHTPDLSNMAEGLETVEKIAAYYLAALQTVQPQGPYLLGGWSAGGIIAFEMAQQLQKQGHEVRVLAIIDSHLPDAHILSVPSSGSRKDIDSRRLLAGKVYAPNPNESSGNALRAQAMEKKIDLGDTGVAKELIRHFKIAVPDDFDQREPDEQLSYAADQAKKMQAIPVDVSLELVRRYTRIGMLNKQIVHSYLPQSYQQQIDYFASHDSREPLEVLDKQEDARGKSVQKDQLHSWHELAKGGMTVHLVPGDHRTLVEEPHVQGLAKALKHCLATRLG